MYRPITMYQIVCDICFPNMLQVKMMSVNGIVHLTEFRKVNLKKKIYSV